MIRRFLLAPVAAAVRDRTRGSVIEGPVEYALYFLGWILWPLDALVRILRLARDGAVGTPPRRATVRCVPLLRSLEVAPAAVLRSRLILQQADALLRPLGLSLDVEAIEPALLPGHVAPPACGREALTGSFFPWASAHAARPPRVTVYFVEDLGSLAGCAVPGADWLVADLRTDGTTIVHELGHLADLWRHHADPDNVMTDRPGGSHDRITAAQAAFLVSSRFAVRISPGESPRRAGS